MKNLEQFKMDEELKKQVVEILKEQLASNLFISRKITDTPTESLMVVNRVFVTANGGTANRPVNPILGQFYFDTDIHKPIWWEGGIFNWVDANGASA